MDVKSRYKDEHSFEHQKGPKRNIAKQPEKKSSNRFIRTKQRKAYWRDEKQSAIYESLERYEVKAWEGGSCL